MFVVSRSDSCPGKSVVALPSVPWKSPIVAQPFQLIARTRREAYRWSDSGGRGKRMQLADWGDAIPPLKGGLLCTS